MIRLEKFFKKNQMKKKARFESLGGNMSLGF
jgi:hypothetical protein